MSRPGDDDEISDETRRAVARARERAAQAPGTAELAMLLTGATADGVPDMSAAQIRALAESTLTHARQVSYLLGRLAGLLDDEAGEGGEP